MPVGLWEFDDPVDPLKPSVGSELLLHGTQQFIAGPWADNNAVRIGIGSYYECRPGITPSVGTQRVNRYSLVVDFRIPSLGPWFCLFQTDSSNTSDGDCFVRSPDGALGVGSTGYSNVKVTPGEWQRITMVVDNTVGLYRIYLDGDLVLRGIPQAVDGRFSLMPALLLFADENGEDAAIDVARVAIYDVALSDADVAQAGAVSAAVSGNDAPTVAATAEGPAAAAVAQNVSYQVAGADSDNDPVRIRVDWGDATELSAWSAWSNTGVAHTFTHVYAQPDMYSIRGLAQDSRGAIGQWTTVAQVTVAGETSPTFLTPPYLQNVTTNSITILWETDILSNSRVEYGTADLALYASPRQSDSGAATHVYRFVLTGLLPGTRYRYRVRAGSKLSTEAAFTTAPALPADFSFAVWSDSQGYNHGAYAADPLEPTKSMFRHMATNNLSFAVTTGDLAESGYSYDDTHRFYLDRTAALLGSGCPWFIAWGNHDGDQNSVIRNFADLPSKQRTGFASGFGSYSFDYAGCHFICIDNAFVASDVGPWLMNDLKSPASRNARFRFLFIHVPPFCELWIDGSSFLRDNLVPQLEAYGVDACFSGHTHEYERGQLNNVFYCVTGGGSWLDSPEVLVREWPHMTVGGYNEIPGIVKPGPERGGGLINEYVRVDVRGNTFTASMIGFAPDGTPLGVFDRFGKTLPEKPISLTATALDAGRIQLAWSEPSAIYVLQQRKEVPGATWENTGVELAPGQTSAVVTNEGGVCLYRLLRVP